MKLPGAEDPVDARELPEDPDRLARRVEEGSAFGRVTPERKREMVGGLRDRGHTVAMTGDGVNDVLALKESDIGVAMGSGSPASRSVAQLVLLDNRFAALPRVVAEGRRVIGNIERVASLFLTKTVYTMVLASVVGLLAVSYPLFPRHATLINAVTFGIPSFFLALAPNTDPARPGFVTRTLRLAIPSGAIAGLAAVTTYLLVLGQQTVPTDSDRTAVVITLCATTLWVLLLVAKPYVWWKVLLVASMAGLLTLAMVTPLGQWFFALDVSRPAEILTALAVAGVAIVAITVVRVVDDRTAARAEARREAGDQETEQEAGGHRRAGVRRPGRSGGQFLSSSSAGSKWPWMVRPWERGASPPGSSARPPVRAPEGSGPAVVPKGPPGAWLGTCMPWSAMRSSIRSCILRMRRSAHPTNTQRRSGRVKGRTSKSPRAAVRNPGIASRMPPAMSMRGPSTPPRGCFPVRMASSASRKALVPARRSTATPRIIRDTRAARVHGTPIDPPTTIISHTSRKGSAMSASTVSSGIANPSNHRWGREDLLREERSRAAQGSLVECLTRSGARVRGRFTPRYRHGRGGG